ncbi:MAG: hypothetical protein BGO98_14195 [Myxococcales bacterium 68-20]|nr:MAG: hypothetical protein BGO98_14195 [Myxococcales bacterium 68-20]
MAAAVRAAPRAPERHKLPSTSRGVSAGSAARRPGRACDRRRRSRAVSAGGAVRRPGELATAGARHLAESPDARKGDELMLAALF